MRDLGYNDSDSNFLENTNSLDIKYSLFHPESDITCPWLFVIFQLLELLHYIDLPLSL